jgi:hypothetical protein
MSNKPAFIEQILDRYPIIKYLEDKGVRSVSSAGNKTRFHCPLPGHDDSTPSFFVFENGHQAYKCFGCLAAGDVINLRCEMERISLKNAIRYFLKESGIAFMGEDAVSGCLQRMVDSYIRTDVINTGELSIKIGRACHDYLELVDFDEDELTAIEGGMKVLDQFVRALDFIQLERADDLFCDVVAPRRHENWLERNEGLVV